MTNRCIDAFKNLSIVTKDNTLGISPCCLVRETPVTFLDFNNAASLTKIRASWAEGISPPECSECLKNEQTVGNSRRLSSNIWYDDHGYSNNDVELIRVDYWVGDTCNLRCAICGPYASSSWKEELEIPNSQRNTSINKYWKDIDLTKLELIHFNGGEPLLSKEHVRFLESIPNKSKVQVTYNTNATVLPSASLLKLWNEFRLVQIDFSIDDIGERFEYQRYPANWQKVTANLKWFVDNCPVNCMFSVNTTVSILNHANLENLRKWLQQNLHSNRVTDPIEHRQQLARGIFSLIEADKNPEKYKEFLDKCDSRRGTNWRKTFPELN